MTVSKLSSHEIKAANGTTQEVSWIVVVPIPVEAPIEDPSANTY